MQSLWILCLLLLLSLSPIVSAAEGDCKLNSDESTLDCPACLTRGCGFAVGMCIESCSMLADAPCYSVSSSSVDPSVVSSSASSICALAASAASDAQLCGAATGDCASCVATGLSETGKTCQWLDGGGCVSECGMMGCGKTTCTTPTTTDLTDDEEADCSLVRCMPPVECKDGEKRINENHCCGGECIPDEVDCSNFDCMTIKCQAGEKRVGGSRCCGGNCVPDDEVMCHFESADVSVPVGWTGYDKTLWNYCNSCVCGEGGYIGCTKMACPEVTGCGKLKS